MNQVSEIFPRPDIKKKLGVSLSIKFPFKYFLLGEKTKYQKSVEHQELSSPYFSDLGYVYHNYNADALIYGGMEVWVRSTSISSVS